MRSFIAIELPQEIKDTLGRLQQKLKTAGADVKWVEPKNIHLTLKFLGEIDEPTKDRISSSLKEICRSKSAFSISLSSCGAFPTTDSPRVIWAGIKDGDSQVKAIAQHIENNLAQIGLPKEDREFSSHITLGRTRSSKNRKQLSELLSNLKTLEGSFPAAKLTLYKSTLPPRGPVYEILQEFQL
jgi:RNA 2',3'-cyclic 3'-phosphodiesterase